MRRESAATMASVPAVDVSRGRLAAAAASAAASHDSCRLRAFSGTSDAARSAVSLAARASEAGGRVAAGALLSSSEDSSMSSPVGFDLRILRHYSRLYIPTLSSHP